MRRNSDSAGAGVALTTFAGFIVIVLFTSALGSYIGRHSTPDPTEVAPPSASEAPSASSPAEVTRTSTPGSAFALSQRNEKAQRRLFCAALYARLAEGNLL